MESNVDDSRKSFEVYSPGTIQFHDISFAVCACNYSVICVNPSDILHIGV